MALEAMVCAPIVPVSLTASSFASPRVAAYLLHDEPGLVWRSTGLSGQFLRVNLSDAWDTIALMGSNLRATATIRVRAGASSAATDAASGAPLDITFNAHTGKMKRTGAMSFHKLNAPVNHPWVRIDITDAGNPDGYLQASRLVFGKAIECDGIDNGAEVSYENRSTSNLLRFKTTPTWKMTFSGIERSAFYGGWDIFLDWAAERNAFLFVPIIDGPYMHQEMGLATLNAVTKVTHNNWETVEIEVTAQLNL